MKTEQQKTELAAPSNEMRWWTGAVPGVGGGTAFASRAFDAREEIARELGASPQDVEVVEC